MNIEEALVILDTAIKPERLNDIQEIVLQESLAGKTYPVIAENAGYEANYIKDVGSKLWKLLSQKLGQEVTKSNIQSVLRRLKQTPPIVTSLESQNPNIENQQTPSNWLELNGNVTAITNTYQDWGEAVDVSVFHGRTTELAKLQQWMINDSCRLVVVLGMGGVGKTALSVKLAEQVQGEFEYLIWRSLRNAPPLEDILAELIQFLSIGQQINLSETIDGRISQLIDYLRCSRCLLILDNVETILCSGEQAGHYRQGYEAYGKLLRRIGEVRHQSCLLLTSREKPKEFVSLEGEGLPIRSLQLSGVTSTEGYEIIKLKGLVSEGLQPEVDILIERYAGNPLALKIVATTIKDLFDGNISEFLAHGTVVFDDIREVLEHQFNRLSDLEQNIMYWLGIAREVVSLSQLREDIIEPVSSAQLLEALVSLRRRSLVEKNIDDNTALFTLQPVVMEYVTNRLIERVCEEIINKHLILFRSHALIKAQAQDYIRASQIRCILQPLIEKLLTCFTNINSLDFQLNQILFNLKPQSFGEQGYTGGNIINLLCQMQADLSKYDFSHLAIWQAYLQNVNLHQVNFAHADMSKSVFANNLSAVLSVAFSVDGQILATADVDGAINLWQVRDGKQLVKCKGHNSWVHAIAFSPQGNILASGSADQTIKLWNVSTGECVRTLQAHTSRVWSVAFSEDGKLLATGSEDQTIKLWDIDTGYCLNTLHNNTGKICTVAFDWVLASGGEDGIIRLWDVSTQECIGSLQGHTGWVWSIAFSHDGNILASGGDDHTVKLWDVRTHECIATLEGHSSRVWSVAFSPEGGIVASGGDDQTVKLWNIKTGECVKTLQGHTQWVWSVAFSPDGQILASGGEDQTVRLWDVNTLQCLRTLQGYTDQVWSVNFSPQGNILASGSDDRTVKLWNIKTGECIKTLASHTHKVWFVAFSNDGKFLASGSDDHTIKLWDLETFECKRTFRGHSSRVWSVVFSPDDRLLASGSGDHTIKLWDIETLKCVTTLSEHTSRVWSVAFSPDGKLLASGSGDRTIKLWDTQTGECKTLLGHLNWVFSVAFSPDGKTLVSGAGDKTIKLWDVVEGKCLKTLQNPSKLILSVTFSPDGNKIASGSDDHKIRLWDINSGKCDEMQGRHTGWVWSVAFSPDGTKIASGSQDETIKLWDINSSTCTQTFRSPKPYEGMNITGVVGLTEATINTLQALGAVVDAKAQS